MELIVFIIFSLLFSIFVHTLSLLNRKKLPPGPIGLPIVGSLFEIGSKPHESLAKLAKKHGPLMTIRLGHHNRIVASSAQIAREILQKNDEACSGRVIPDAVTALADHKVAVLWISANEEWRIIRRALNTFLTHPHKLDTLVGLRQNVLKEMVMHVMSCCEKGVAIDIGKLAFATTLNQMSNTCISENVDDFKSKDVRGFLNTVKTLMVVDGTFNIADVFLWLKPFDPQGLRRRAKVAYSWFDELIEGYIDRRLQQRASEAKRNHDLLDSLLDFSEQNESVFNLKHIKVLLVDLFLAGTETTSNTTEWAMTELILNPRVMEKLRREIVESVKRKGSVEEVEILNLPYLQAVVKETTRLHLAVPLLAPHKTETNVELNGYMIPKNTQIYVNVWAIARDEKYWENPTTFMPERFISNPELDFKGQDFSFIPFGSGRRMCPGISLAQRMVSLMIASLVYHFEWKLQNGIEKLDMSDTFGLTLLRSTPLLAVPYNPKEVM